MQLYFLAQVAGNRDVTLTARFKANLQTVMFRQFACNSHDTRFTMGKITIICKNVLILFSPPPSSLILA